MTALSLVAALAYSGALNGKMKINRSGGTGGAQIIQITEGPVLGAVSATSIKVWVRTSAPGPVTISYKRQADSDYTLSASGSSTAADDSTVVVPLTGLTANTAYHYKVLGNGVERVGANTFTTLPSGASAFTFAVGADLDYTRIPHEAMAQVKTSAPGFLLMIGDVIYADVPANISTLEQYRVKYRQQYAEANAISFFNDFPTMFMWDDHEIRNNWASGKTGVYINARDAFEEYAANLNPTPRTAGELYYSFTAGQCDFYVLDPRTFRSAGSTMLGTVQLADLKAWLSASTGKFKFVVTPVLFSDFSVTGGSDSWADGFASERSDIIAYIKANAITDVVILSGDQHTPLAVRGDYGDGLIMYEFEPTPLNAGPFSATASNDAQILFKANGTTTFGLFEMDTTVSPATMTVSFINKSGTVLYTVALDQDDF